MGLFDFLNKDRKAKINGAMETFRTINAYTPSFTTWNGAIYEAELVRAAVDARARHISKLAVNFTGSGQPSMRKRMDQGPNSFQTWSQFLYRVSTILDVQNNAFIVPLLDSFGQTVGIFPILPSRTEVLECRGELYLRYSFGNGKTATIELNRCGILNKFQYKDDFFGENNTALNPTMEVIHAQNEGITEAVSSSATYRFMAKMNNFAKPEDLAAERKQFSENNFRSGTGGGLLLFPNTYADIRQIESKPFTIDAAQMELINGNVQKYFGVSEKIMQNEATDEEMDAFFNGAIEPFSIQASEVLTGMLFTERERQLGNKLMLTANRLQYMSVAHKISMATQLGDRGMIMIDEIRELFNYPPLPDGQGKKAPIRGEYYFQGEKKGDEDGET